MWTGEALIVSGTVTGGGYDAVRPGLFRLQVDGRAFFGHRDHLANPELLSRVNEGDAVFIGAHALDLPGTHWLHWLHIPGKETIDSRRRGGFMFFMHVFMVLMGAVTVFVAFTAGLENEESMRKLVQALVYIVVAGSFAMLGISYRRYRGSRLRQDLNYALERIRAGFPNAAGVRPAVTLPLPSQSRPDTALVAGAEREVELLEGEARNLSGEREHLRYAGAKVNRGVYRFVCAGREVFWQFLNPSDPWEYRSPGAITRVPEFLAEGDTISLLLPTRRRWHVSYAWINRHDYSGTTGATEVAALLNHVDGKVYLPKSASRFRRGARLLIFPTLLLIFCAFWERVFGGVTALIGDAAGFIVVMLGIIFAGILTFVTIASEAVFSRKFLLTGDEYAERLEWTLHASNGLTEKPREEWRDSSRARTALRLAALAAVCLGLAVWWFMEIMAL